MNLSGESRWTPPDQKRVSMDIHPYARERLSRLLHRPEMRGVGYSEFVLRAIERAEAELAGDVETDWVAFARDWLNDPEAMRRRLDESLGPGVHLLRRKT